jgi:hypothetical protein
MFNAAANMIDLGALVVLIIIACIIVCAWCFIIFYLCTHASMFFAFLTTNDPQSNELRLETHCEFNLLFYNSQSQANWSRKNGRALPAVRGEISNTEI